MPALRTIASISLFMVFAIATGYLGYFVYGHPDAAAALKKHDPGGIEIKEWLAVGAPETCSKTLCLVVNHVPNAVEIELTTFEPEIIKRELRLLTKVTLNENQGLELFAEHDPVPEILDEMVANGVDLDIFRKNAVLYSVSGAFSWRTAKVELPYGVFGQFFFDGMQKVDKAMGNETDLEVLQKFAKIAVNEVNARFEVSELADRALISQITAGPTQTLTYIAALIAILLTLLEIRIPEVRRYSDGMADLIPFTGFFGTLIGVAGGLQILGLSDVTDDVSKALSLGKIGSSLSLAINTTILAIVVFGLVLIFQFALRILLDEEPSKV